MRTKTFFILTLFLFSWCLNETTAYADSPKIIAANIAGNVFIVRGENIIPVTDNVSFQQSDKIVTGADAQVDVVWKGKWGYRLLANSDCVLTSTKKSDSRVVMNAGDIIVNMKKIDEDTAFKLETPVLIAAVRGTQFWGRVDKSSDGVPTTVAVREGVVEITSKQLNETISVSVGQAVDLSLNAVSLGTRDAKPGEMQAMTLAEQIPV